MLEYGHDLPLIPPIIQLQTPEEEVAEIFSIRIKSIRLAYNLSLDEMTKLLELNNKTGLFAWENGKACPLAGSLVSIADVLGVTTDWLFGRSDIIHTNESVAICEKGSYKKNPSVPTWMNATEAHDYTLRYWNEIGKLSSGTYYIFCDDYRMSFWASLSRRNKVYSLEDRVSIAVLLDLVPLGDILWAKEYLDSFITGIKKGEILTKVNAKLWRIGMLESSEKYKEPGKKAKERAINLAKLLCRDKCWNKLGIYSVEDTFYELQQSSNKIKKSSYF